MTQRTFQMPFHNQDGVPAAEVINLWLKQNPCCELTELHTAQCECGAPLLFGVVRVMDDFEGELPGEDEYDYTYGYDEDECFTCPDREDCENIGHPAPQLLRRVPEYKGVYQVMDCCSGDDEDDPEDYENDTDPDDCDDCDEPAGLYDEEDYGDLNKPHTRHHR